RRPPRPYPARSARRRSAWSRRSSATSSPRRCAATAATSRAPPRSSACTARTCSRRCESSASPPSREGPMQLLRRTVNLVRGLASRWLGRREHRHPDAVYEAAIHERLGRYVKLREATAGILYLRSKLAKELERQSDELVRVRRQLEIAVDRNDDQVALHLIG